MCDFIDILFSVFGQSGCFAHKKSRQNQFFSQLEADVRIIVLLRSYSSYRYIL
jgi:hypothetical protein